MSEAWRPVSGFEPLYEVSDQGRVRRSAPGVGGRTFVGLVLAATFRRGYARVKLYDRSAGKCRTIAVHQLVATAFCEKPADAIEVNHIDLDKSNNRATNLEWLTHPGNIQHAAAAGRMGRTGPRPNERRLRGDASPQARLTSAEAAEIRATYIPRDFVRGGHALAKRFGVSYQLIWRVVTGKAHAAPATYGDYQYVEVE